MFKLFVFDLDGVLIDSTEMHHGSLVEAIKAYDPNFVFDDRVVKIISASIPTKEKLVKIGFDQSAISLIAEEKQRKTMIAIQDISEDRKLVKLFKKITKHSIIAIASNSHTNTVAEVIFRLGVSDYVDFIVGNDEVQHTKPHPEMYIRCMNRFGVSASDTIVFEDSVVGLTAARLSGARTVEVDNSKDLKRKLRKYIVH